MLKDKLLRLYDMDRKASASGFTAVFAVYKEGYSILACIISGISTWSVIRLIPNGPREKSKEP
jgi:hypothetical protein